MTENFNKVIRIGTVTEGLARESVFCSIKFTDGKLSITGVVGPRASGNCAGSCGQIVMSLKDSNVSDWTFAPGWQRHKMREFFRIWDRWHLNDMVAGSPEQMAFLRAQPKPLSYDAALIALKAANLQPDTSGYSYGSAWLREEIPAEIVEFLKALPDTDKTPAWV